jgi:hypothetical protein
MVKSPPHTMPDHRSIIDHLANIKRRLPEVDEIQWKEESRTIRLAFVGSKNGKRYCIERSIAKAHIADHGMIAAAFKARLASI